MYQPRELNNINSKKNLNTIRSEIRAALENSGEFSLENFEKKTKDEMMKILLKLRKHLKNGTISDDFFQQVTNYNKDFENFGATFAKRDSSIKIWQFKKVFFEEIKKALEGIENRFQFTLVQNLQSFDKFLSYNNMNHYMNNYNNPSSSIFLTDDRAILPINNQGRNQITIDLAQNPRALFNFTYGSRIVCIVGNDIITSL